MAVFLTNGTQYIALTKTGGITKVTDIKQAEDFESVSAATSLKNRATKKCSGFRCIDTKKKGSSRAAAVKTKRKSFSADERRAVYRKTEGHCYLCGKFVDFDAFEVEHKVPLSKGGSNDLDNLFCACHFCNTLKCNEGRNDFQEKIYRIFMHQMNRKYKNHLKWRIIRKELQKMIP